MQCFRRQHLGNRAAHFSARLLGTSTLLGAFGISWLGACHLRAC
ncbi:hypothetical protein [Kribbella solani]|uniref:Uncharacterized protein n=1 Tax=Kribbella solani TaxID=236067 RepID=A0A841DGF0_9ACTN|nr:hypothetical protein [Kribbella solani]MBB5977603.1 hypothetical protein [Kribbella solani]